MTGIYDKLVKNALYAIRSNNEHLVYQCLGGVAMAYELGAITGEEYRSLDVTLVPGWLNNVVNRKELAKTITEEDIRRAR